MPDTRGLYYYVGEKPQPLPCEFVDKDGTLDASIAGSTLTALVNIDTDSGGEQSIPCTNNGDGTFTIDWPTGTSAFTSEGDMSVDVKVATGSYEWFMPRFYVEVRER